MPKGGKRICASSLQIVEFEGRVLDSSVIGITQPPFNTLQIGKRREQAISETRVMAMTQALSREARVSPSLVCHDP